MKIDLTYAEIEKYLKDNKKQDFAFSYVSPSAIQVETNVNVSFFTKHIVFDISLDKIVGDDVYLLYSLSNSNDIVVRTAFPLFRPRLNSKLPMADIGGDTVVVHLAKVKHLDSALKVLQLKDARFDSIGVVMSLNIR